MQGGADAVPLSALIVKTMATNVGGVAATVEHMAPLLERAAKMTPTRAPRIVFMSSSVGSLTKAAPPNGFVVTDYPAYSASKSALNMLALHYYYRFPDWKVNMCCPGFRVSDNPPSSRSPHGRDGPPVPPYERGPHTSRGRWRGEAKAPEHLADKPMRGCLLTGHPPQRLRR